MRNQSAGESRCNVLSLLLHACSDVHVCTAKVRVCNMLSLLLHARSDVHVCTAKEQVNPRALDIADKGFAITDNFRYFTG